MSQVKICDLCGEHIKNDSNAVLSFKEKDKEFRLDICEFCLKEILKLSKIAHLRRIKRRVFG